MGYHSRRIFQVAALPLIFGAEGRVDVWLVTSRGSGRWIIPKGNPINRVAPHEAAEQEAFEEAGLIGKVDERPIGQFEFMRRRDGSDMICAVDVYLLKVERQMKKWPEMGQRSVLRCDLKTAVSLVEPAGLSSLISRQVALLASA
jgi:8-oxo-dGTP pyrophosphatase MutT (NUDIX family)